MISKEIAENTNYDIKAKNVSAKDYKQICKSFITPFNLSKFPLFKIEMYILNQDKFELKEVFIKTGTISPHIFPEFSFEVAEIFDY